MIVDLFNTYRKYDVIYADSPWEYKQRCWRIKQRKIAKAMAEQWGGEND